MARHKYVIHDFRQVGALANPAFIHGFVAPMARSGGRLLQRAPEKMGDFADDAAAERQHAGDENGTLDHRHP